MKPLRIGFLGTGWIAATHVKSLAKLQNIEVVALCNPHIEKARAFNEKHLAGHAACHADFDQMLKAESLDALYVCVPPGSHTGQVEAAAAKGVHLFLEKPIALTLDRATSIYTAVQKAGVKCAISHQMRHTAPSIKLKQMLTDGSAGKPLMLQGRFFTNALYPAWWRDPQRGGGQLIEQAIHIYDIARYFLGDAQAAAGFKDNLIHQRFPDYRVDDVSASVIRFQNGALAGICAANCADPQVSYISFTVMCEKVYVEFRSHDDATFVHHGGKVADEYQPGEQATREEVKTAGSCYDELTRNFIAAIRNGEPVRASITDGLESLRLVLAAAASSNAGGQTQSCSALPRSPHPSLLTGIGLT